MSESGDDGSQDEEQGSKDWSIPSDGESHDLKIPYFSHRVHYPTCAVAFRILLWTLVVTFQALPLAWISLMSVFFSQSPSYITWLMNTSIGLCGGIEIIFSGFITVLAIIQLLQKGSYKFVHKSRVIFNVVVAAFLSHLLVFFALSFIARFSIFQRMEKEMRRELRAYRNPIHSLDVRWERTQEKYECCGFGGESDYANFPPSCCPQDEVNCGQGNRWKRNCFMAESQDALYFMDFGTGLLGVGIPFAILFYLGFRYFRPYWQMDHQSLESLDEKEKDVDGEESEEVTFEIQE